MAAAAKVDMLLLDTDHISEISRSSVVGRALDLRLAAATEKVGTTIIAVEELLRGQLAQIAGARRSDRLVVVYARAQQAITGLSRSLILPFDAAAAEIFERLRKARLGVATMDLRIASIVIANSATLLSRNLKDFERVPELKVEDWLS